MFVYAVLLQLLSMLFKKCATSNLVINFGGKSKVGSAVLATNTGNQNQKFEGSNDNEENDNSGIMFTRMICLL